MKQNKRGYGILAGIAIAGVLLFGCGKNTAERKFIHVDGSSTVYPITEAVGEEFQKSHPGIKTLIGVSGTGGGFKKFLRNETQINDASRAIKQKEIDLAKKNNIKYIELPVAYDGIAVVVHPKNTWCNKLTIDELKLIWSPAAQKKIIYWDQVRKGWPHKEIHLFGPGVDSGTYDYFTEEVVGKMHSSRGDYTSSADPNVLVQGISTDESALGFFGLAYYKENADRLKLVPVFNGKTYVKPTIETVSKGVYKPLSRPLFIYINKSALEKPEVKTFVEYYLANVKPFLKEVGYVKLPDEMYKKVWERYEARKTGTMFGGGESLSLMERLSK